MPSHEGKTKNQLSYKGSEWALQWRHSSVKMLSLFTHSQAVNWLMCSSLFCSQRDFYEVWHLYIQRRHQNYKADLTQTSGSWLVLPGTSFDLIKFQFFSLREQQLRAFPCTRPWNQLMPSRLLTLTALPCFFFYCTGLSLQLFCKTTHYPCLHPLETPIIYPLLVFVPCSQTKAACFKFSRTCSGLVEQHFQVVWMNVNG